jgi:hypothetical protein
MHKIYALLRFLLFVNVQGCAFRVGYGVGAVEGAQVNLVKTDARAYGYDEFVPECPPTIQRRF